jgi:hypothetical protein
MRASALTVVGFVAHLIAVGASASPGLEPTALAERVSYEAGSARIELLVGSEASFERPVLRLLRLPPGAREPWVEFADEATEQALAVEVGDPVIIRGLRAVPLSIRFREAAAQGGAAPAAREFRVRYREGGLRSPAGEEVATRFSRGFFAPYEDLLWGAEPSLSLEAGEGGYLIVTVPEFVATLAPFIAWKRELGHDVLVVTTDEAGTTNAAIQAYLQGFYQSATVPPQYVLLVGDVEQIPGFEFGGSVTDLRYSLLDGDDFFPDVELGRLSAQTIQQLETSLAKILGYEQDPYRSGGNEWFSRALMVAGNMGSATPVPTARWCRTELLSPEVGYAEVDTVYYPPHDATGPFMIRPIVDAGVSIVSYRGWALGAEGWDAPQFTVDDIPSLSNGWMLPAVFSFVCLNGDYAEPECFGEAWVRAGTATTPKGGVGFIGNSEHWSHTRYNDAAAIGAFKAIRADGVRRFGQLLSAARVEILEQFPDRLSYAQWTDESVEFYYYIYALLGDPSLEIWMTAPRTLTVVHADSLPQGSNALEVSVADGVSALPVSGARVGVSQGDVVLGCERTDSSGFARILASFEDTSEPVKITVSGTGLSPYRDSLAVFSGGPFLALESVTIDDDGAGGSVGNGDGLVNPGETVELDVGIRNRGADAAAGVQGTLVSLEGATVNVGGVGFPDVAVGGTATSNDPFVVAMATDAEDGAAGRLRLELTTSAGDTSSAGFDLVIRAPAHRYESCVVGGDGVLDPGETAQLTVTLRNDGSVPASLTQGILRSATPDIATVTDSIGSFGPAPVGITTTQTSPFSVQIGDSVAVGQAAAFTLALTTAEGYEGRTTFSLVVGEVDHRAPSGPDAYGYYAYDNSDTDYPDAVPVYEWVSCSPSYGGAGTALPLGDDQMVVVVLPFPFTFYGSSYDSMLVSDNGWVSFEIAPYLDYYNWGMPNTYGTGAQIAPFWDNLDPTKEYEGVLVGDGIYTYHDAANHRFIVEWSRLGNVRSQHMGENRPDWDDLQTFELILFDPAYTSTPTGDGIIRFQYRQIVNNDDERMYATVGIENETEDIGLEYTYSNLYPASAAPLSAGLAIDFTTRQPRYNPFRLARCEAAVEASGVQLSWEPGDDRVLGGYRVYRAVAGTGFRLVKGGCLGPAAREYLDTQVDPHSAPSYKLGAVDAVGRETLFGPFPTGVAREPQLSLALTRSSPNPSVGSVLLRYSLPERRAVQLGVYSVTGRRVRKLVAGDVEAGVWDARWDGRDDDGRGVASGVYFVKLAAGAEQRKLKITLIR